MRDVTLTVDYATAVNILGFLKRDYLQKMTYPGAQQREATLRRIQLKVAAADTQTIEVTVLSEVAGSKEDPVR